MSSLIRQGAFIAALALGVLVAGGPLRAADKGALGGDCCSDLEERIAELEATAARKGTRAVSLTVSGQINAVLSDIEAGSYSDHKISQNGNDQSYLRVSGAAKINPDLSAGYTLEINIVQLGLLNAPIGGQTEPLTRQSFWFLKSEALGQISMGRQSQATNDFDKAVPDNAWLAGKPLSAGSLSDLYLTGIDLPFDGGYRDTVKYVSPTLAGFTLAATWGATIDGKAADGTGNGYDVALRYDSRQGGKDVFSDFHVMGAVGYRRSTDFDINLLNITHLQLPTGDVDTFLVSGGVLNYSTGIFVNGEFADQKWQDFGFTLQGFDVTAGLHQKWTPLGATEVFGSWGRVSFQPDGYSDTNIDYWGLGATQDIEGAAMQLYVGWRHYDTKDELGTNIDAFNAGAVVHF